MVNVGPVLSDVCPVLGIEGARCHHQPGWTQAATLSQSGFFILRSWPVDGFLVGTYLSSPSHTIEARQHTVGTVQAEKEQ